MASYISDSKTVRTAAQSTCHTHKTEPLTFSPVILGIVKTEKN